MWEDLDEAWDIEALNSDEPSWPMGWDFSSPVELAYSTLSLKESP